MSSNHSFFEELQSDFLNEISFLLETYEEHMLGLENDENKKEHLNQIFRVAHSIKGGAAAVGFQDFSHFAHHVEDLLSVLRAAPEFVNSEIISVLLRSGDEFKNRVQMLRDNDNSVWNVSPLENHISQILSVLTEGMNLNSTAMAPTAVEKKNRLLETVAPTTASLTSATTLAAAAETAVTTAAATTEVSIAEMTDHTNYELLNELMEQKPKTPEKVVQKDVKLSAKTHNINQIIKVDTARVDNVLNAVGELVVLKNQIVQNEVVKSGNNAELVSIVDQIDKAVRELYERTLSIRMTPLKSLFLKIQRIVRDVSLSLDKPVNLELRGEETEVERTVFELLGDPLVHLVRNAMDHGVEPKETRQKNNKPEAAKVIVSAKQMGGDVIIEISDDGGGISREKVLAKAIEKNIVPQGANPDLLSNEDVYKLIFAPGFSTAEKISDLSGRGVGLDVVKSNIEKVNGKINIESKEGQGSVFKLTIPLSTAITDGIVVQIKSERYILPIYTIKEIIRVKKDLITPLPNKGKVAKVRDHLHTVLDLDPLLKDLAQKNYAHTQYAPDVYSPNTDEVMLVIIESGHLTAALPVDDVLGQAQVVVKSLMMGKEIPDVSGAAILGDGKTVLILDPGHIMKESIEAVA
ncbi:MAG: chemotaxis protein CheA [Bdellovibrionaceae bacterium]|nr:chemotaxis protein CheA [Pseudobdellovibrionaceae bacterium]